MGMRIKPDRTHVGINKAILRLFPREEEWPAAKYCMSDIHGDIGHISDRL